MPFTDILARRADTGRNIYTHVILVRGSDFEVCKNKVLRFFDKYLLVRYSRIDIREKESLPATIPGFGGKLDGALHKNRQILNELVKQLRNEGVNTLKEIEELPQGYKTKLLHVITHFLDGFFGIDTYFYNLEEDSHWVSKDMLKSIKQTPSRYWMIELEGRI